MHEQRRGRMSARRRGAPEGILATRIKSLLRQLRAKMNRVRERELAAALRRLPDLTPAQRVAVERLSRALLTKFMREPSVRLRAAAADGHGLAVVDAAGYLFALEEPLADQRETEGNAHGGDVQAA
jgi:glutamyl-tRNA reductase